MIIMAHTMSGKMEELKIQSCPMLIAQNVLALLDRNDSPLYLEDTVVLYDEVHDIAEGDVVINPKSKKRGIIYYSGGWRIHWSEGVYNKYVVSEHINMTKRGRRVLDSQSVRKIQEREEIKIVVDGEALYLTCMMAKHHSLICISGKPQLVNQNEIYLSSGIYDNLHAPLYFGQFYKGGIVGLDDEMRVVSKNTKTNIILED